MPSFLNDLHDSTLIRLSCGTTFDLARPRWDGPLPEKDIDICRQAGIPLAYDPAQIGWVLAERQTREEFAVRVQTPPRATHPSAVQSRFKLRAWRATDVDDYVELLDDPAVWAHLPEAYPAPLTRDLAETLIELSNASNHHEVRAVTMADKPIGQVRLLFGDDEAADRAEISYWLGRKHWGQGIATEMVGHYTHRSFGQQPQLQSLFARVHEDNGASARVLEKSGYRLQGPDASRAGWQLFVLQRPDAGQ